MVKLLSFVLLSYYLASVNALRWNLKVSLPQRKMSLPQQISFLLSSLLNVGNCTYHCIIYIYVKLALLRLKKYKKH